MRVVSRLMATDQGSPSVPVYSIRVLGKPSDMIDWS